MSCLLEIPVIVIQCELWTDNNDMGEEKVINLRRENIVPSLSYFAESLVLFTETLKTFVKTIFASILAHLYPPARHTN